MTLKDTLKIMQQSIGQHRLLKLSQARKSPKRWQGLRNNEVFDTFCDL